MRVSTAEEAKGQPCQISETELEAIALCKLVDAFAEQMKARLLEQLAKGFKGWDDRDICSDAELLERMNTHAMLVSTCSKEEVINKSLVDAANFSMFIWNRQG